MMMLNLSVYQLGLLLLAIVVVVGLYYYYTNMETFANNESSEYSVMPDDSNANVYGNVEQTEEGQAVPAVPADCFPKDQLKAEELLPGDDSSKWAQVNPKGEGSLGEQNFLDAGYHIGINTVGQSLRNANRQLRSEPPNPQEKVSPWLQSTIEPDINRKPLEIGEC